MRTLPQVRFAASAHSAGLVMLQTLVLLDLNLDVLLPVSLAVLTGDMKP